MRGMLIGPLTEVTYGSPLAGTSATPRLKGCSHPGISPPPCPRPRRHDLWNTRLRLAVFKQPRGNSKPGLYYTLWAPSASGDLEEAGRAGVFRGPLVPGWLHPTGQVEGANGG